MTPPLIFISYCREDKAYKDELCTYLRTLERDGQITLWLDEQIKTGQGWDEAIQTAIKNADIAILLVTTNFLNSEFISKVEVPLILQRRDQEDLEIFPILADDCLWDEIPWLCSMQLWSEGDASVWCLEDVKRKKALLKIGKAIANLAHRVREQPVPIDPPQSKITSKSPQPTPSPEQPVEVVRKQDISKGPSVTPTYSVSSRKKRPWYALVLLVTLSCFWFYSASIAYKKTDPPKLTLLPFIINLPQHKFISPDEHEKLWFGIRNDDSSNHRTLFLLQSDITNQCSPGVVGDNTIYEGEVEGRRSASTNEIRVRCSWSNSYFGKPRPAGLELEWKVDDSPRSNQPLPLYIAPFPYIRTLNIYLGFSTLVVAVFFLFLWLLQESNLNLRRHVSCLIQSLPHRTV